MNIAILQANLGNFDNPVDPVAQKVKGHNVVFHRWTDENFPQIADLPGRFQYRIPKLFGWEMLPGYDYYIWLDGGISFKRDDSAQYYLDQLGDNDIAFFHHPQRHTIKAEVDHIEEYLQKGNKYITPRYKGGLHKEQYEVIKASEGFIDNKLWASTTFIYKSNEQVWHMMMDWWLFQSRYYTCDQVVLPWVLWKHKMKVADFDEPIFKTGYMSLVSHHK